MHLTSRNCTFPVKTNVYFEKTQCINRRNLTRCPRTSSTNAGGQCEIIFIFRVVTIWTEKNKKTIRTQCVKTLSVIFYGYFILYSMYNGNSTEHRIDLTINPNIECNVCKTAIQINFDQTVSWVLHQWWLFLLLLVCLYMILCIVFFIIIFYQSYIHNGLLF